MVIYLEMWEGGEERVELIPGTDISAPLEVFSSDGSSLVRDVPSFEAPRNLGFACGGVFFVGQGTLTLASNPYRI